MRRAAVAAYPEECCGLLVGRTDVDGRLAIFRAVATANVAADDRRRRFEVDPAVHFRLLRDLRGGPDRVVGHYHSHPDHPATPSAEDRAMAFDPGLVWLIIAVAAIGAGDIAAFRPRVEGTGFAPLPLRIVEHRGGFGDD